MKKSILLTINLLLIMTMAFSAKLLAQTCSVSQTASASLRSSSTLTEITQTFIPCSSGQLNSITLSHGSGTTVSGYTMFLVGPTGTSSAVGFSAAANTTVAIDFSSVSYYLSAGETYTIHISRAAGNLNGFSFRYSTDSNSYPDGNINWDGDTTGDLYFVVNQQTFTAPTLVPTHLSTGIARTGSLTLTYLQEMKAATGNLSLKNLSNMNVTAIAVTDLIYHDDGKVEFPLSDALEPNTSYSVYFPLGAFKTTATEINALAIDDGDWTFTTTDRPAVSISSTEGEITDSNPFTVNIEFTASVSGFTINDIDATNAVLSNFTGSGANYSVSVAPIDQGEVTLSIAADVAEASGPLFNTASAVYSILYDSEFNPAQVSASVGNETTNPIFTVTFEFDEDIFGLDEEDFQFEKVKLLSYDLTGSIATLEVEATASGTLRVILPENSLTDRAAYGNQEAVFTTEYTIDLISQLIINYPFNNIKRDVMAYGPTLNKTTNGALPTVEEDRFSNGEGAYLFSGTGILFGSLNLGANSTNGFAINAWIQPFSALNGASAARFIYRHDGRTSLYYNAGKLIWSVSGTNFEYDTTFVAGEWYHLALTAESGGAVKFYINNTELSVSGTAAASIALNNAANIFFGGQMDGGGNTINSFNGVIDDFRIYKRNLEAVEIDSLFNSPEFTYELRATVICQGESVSGAGNEYDTAGSYSFVEEDGINPNWVTLPLTVNTLPSLNVFAGTTEICAGQGVKLYAASNGSVVWDNEVQNGAYVYPNVTTTYTVTATSAQDCEVTDQVTITVSSSPITEETLSTAQTIYCDETNISTAINTQSSQIGYDYYLIDAATNEVIDGPKAGTGSALSFDVAELNSSRTFGIYAEEYVDGSTSSLEFDGVDDKVVVTYNSSLAISNAFTWEGWLYPESTTYRRYFSNYLGSGNILAGNVIIDGGTSLDNGRGVRFLIGTGTSVSTSATANSVLTLNDWNHVACVFNNGAMTIYVNGVSVATATLPTTSVVGLTENWVLGEDRGGIVNEFFDGKMDDVRFWNVARSEEDILALKDRSLNGNEHGLMLYYPFNQPSGSTMVIDHSLNNNHGTLTNMDVANVWVSGTVPANVGCVVTMEDNLTITVGDNDGPEVITKNISVSLGADGTLTIDPEDVDNGTADVCTGTDGLVFSLDRMVFGCNDIGDQTVMLTVEDPLGNESSAEATVTILPYQEDFDLALENETVCIGNDAVINMIGSNVGVSYSVVDNSDDAVLSGPIAGTGSAISFTLPNIQEAGSYRIRAEIDGLGESQHALQFDGGNTSITYGNNNRNITNTVTISAWVKTSFLSGNSGVILSKTTGGQGYRLYISNGQAIFQVFHATSLSNFRSSGVSVADGEWHYITGVYSPTEISIYVDGTLRSTATLNLPNVNLTNSLNMITGYDGFSSFNGQIDQIALWNRALTAAEISESMNACMSGSETSVVGLFKFDQGTGSGTVTDYSSLGLGGTLLAINTATAWQTGLSPSCPVGGCGVDLTQHVNLQVTTDTEAPSIIAQDITVHLGLDGTVTVDPKTTDNGTTDNCTPFDQLVFSLSKDSFDCTETGEHVVSLTVTDNAGNSASEDLTITVAGFVEEKAVSAAVENICAGSSINVSLANSQPDVFYTLINTANDQAIGSVKEGNGATLGFPTGAINENTTFGIKASPNLASQNAGLTFDGVDDKILLPTTVSQHFAGTSWDLTFEAWIYPTKNQYSRIMTSFSGSTVDVGSIVFDTYSPTDASGRGLRFFYKTPDEVNHEVSAPNVLTLNAWNHVAIVYETSAGGQMRLYSNGQLVASKQTNYQLQSFPYPFVLGEDHGGANPEFFEGKMDEVRFWNTARTTAQIQANLNNCLQGNESGLVIYYNFDNGSGSAVSDITTNEYNGSMINFDTASAWSAGKLKCTGSACEMQLAQTVTITTTDEEAPVLIGKNISIELDNAGQAVLGLIDAVESVTDNCTNFGDLQIELSKSEFSCSDTGENTVTITVTDLAGNSNSVEVTVLVEDNMPPIAIAQNITLQLDEQDTPITITAEDIDNGSSDNCSLNLALGLSQTTFTVLDAGENEVTLTVTDESGNESTATAIVTVLGNKEQQTINFSEINNKQYGDEAFGLTATANTGLTVTFSSSDEAVATVSGNLLNITGTGEVTITASVEGNDEFYPAESSQTFTVNKANLVITADNLSSTFGADIPSLTYQVSGFVYGEDESVLTAAVSISTEATNLSDAGEYAIVPAAAETDNYDISFINGILIIGQATQVIDFADMADVDFIELEGNIVLSATASTGLEVTFEVITGPATLVNGNELSISGTGTVNVRALQVGNNNYQAAEASQSFNVFDSSKEDQIITFEEIQDKTFGDAAFVLSATASSGLDVNFEVISGQISIEGNIATILGAGEAGIRATQSGNSEFNPAQTVTRSFMVHKADQQISIQAIVVKYITDGDFEVVASSNSGLELTYEVVSGPATINGTTISLTGEEGTVEIRVSQAGNQNYQAAEAGISFEVVDEETVCENFTVGLQSKIEVSCHNGNNGSINIAVSGGVQPYSFIWSNGLESQNATGLTAGVYTVTVRDAAGCEHVMEVTITQPDAIIVETDIRGSNSSLGNGHIHLTVSGGTAPYTYEWNTGVRTAELNNLLGGEYTVAITDALGCVYEGVFEVPTISSSQVAEELKIIAWPNPTTGNWQLEVPQSFVGKRAALVNMHGQITDTFIISGRLVERESTGLASGIYLLRIEGENVQLKLVKK